MNKQELTIYFLLAAMPAGPALEQIKIIKKHTGNYQQADTSKISKFLTGDSQNPKYPNFPFQKR